MLVPRPPHRAFSTAVVNTELGGTGQMLTSCNTCFEEVSSQINSSFHCTGKTVDRVVWMRGLLTSSLRIEWTMVAVRLWYRQLAQVHFNDGTLKCSDTMTRS